MLCKHAVSCCGQGKEIYFQQNFDLFSEIWKSYSHIISNKIRLSVQTLEINLIPLNGTQLLFLLHRCRFMCVNEGSSTPRSSRLCTHFFLRVDKQTSKRPQYSLKDRIEQPHANAKWKGMEWENQWETERMFWNNVTIQSLGAECLPHYSLLARRLHLHL